MTINDIPLDNLIKAPFIFNGGIFKYKNQNYLCYRANYSTSQCELYISKMDKQWNPIGKSWQIKIPILGNIFEDPRFILINDQPHLAITQVDLKLHNQYQGLIVLTEKLTYKKYIKLNYADNWSLVEKQNATKKPNEHYINFQTPISYEKNWCFLDNESSPTFIYKTQPVTITAQFDNSYNLIKEQGDAKDFNWPFGEIRGGAPAIKINDIYYHFFHSSSLADPYSQLEENGIGRIYYLGCYTFKRTFEHFELLNLTRLPLVMGDYTEPVVLWRNVAVFPAGVIYENNQFKISYGWLDYKLKILTISKKELDSLLTPLSIPVYLKNINLNLKKGISHGKTKKK